MTLQEYKQKKRECFVEFCKDNGIDQEVNISIFDAFGQIFDRAYSLGKQEEDAEDTVFQGWVCRDEDNTLTIFYGSNKPSKEDGDDYWSAVFGDSIEYLPQNMFPDVTWDDPEPARVEIIIKRKKNG